MTFANRNHERRLAEALLAPIDGGAVREQRARDLRLADARREQQRRLARRVGLVRVGAGVQQAAHDAHVAFADRDLQRRHAVAIGAVDLRSRREQPPDELVVA